MFKLIKRTLLILLIFTQLPSPMFSWNPFDEGRRRAEEAANAIRRSAEEARRRAEEVANATRRAAEEAAAVARRAAEETARRAEEARRAVEAEARRVVEETQRNVKKRVVRMMLDNLTGLTINRMEVEFMLSPSNKKAAFSIDLDIPVLGVKTITLPLETGNMENLIKDAAKNLTQQLFDTFKVKI